MLTTLSILTVKKQSYYVFDITLQPFSFENAEPSWLYNLRYLQLNRESKTSISSTLVSQKLLKRFGPIGANSRVHILHTAAKYGAVDIIKKYQPYRRDSFNSVDQNGNTPLSLAVKHEQWNTVRYLLACESTPLNVDDLWTFFRKGTGCGSQNLLLIYTQLLVKNNNCLLLEFSSRFKQGAFEHMVKPLLRENLSLLFKKHKLSSEASNWILSIFNSQDIIDAFGTTHDLVLSTNYDFLGCLLKNKIIENWDIQNSQGISPLDLCFIQQNYDVVKLLHNSRAINMFREGRYNILDVVNPLNGPYSYPEISAHLFKHTHWLKYVETVEEATQKLEAYFKLLPRDHQGLEFMDLPELGRWFGELPRELQLKILNYRFFDIIQKCIKTTNIELLHHVMIQDGYIRGFEVEKPYGLLTPNESDLDNNWRRNQEKWQTTYATKIALYVAYTIPHTEFRTNIFKALLKTETKSFPFRSDSEKYFSLQFRLGNKPYSQNSNSLFWEAAQKGDWEFVELVLNLYPYITYHYKKKEFEKDILVNRTFINTPNKPQTHRYSETVQKTNIPLLPNGGKDLKVALKLAQEELIKKCTPLPLNRTSFLTQKPQNSPHYLDQALYNIAASYSIPPERSTDIYYSGDIEFIINDLVTHQKWDAIIRICEHETALIPAPSRSIPGTVFPNKNYNDPLARIPYLLLANDSVPDDITHRIIDMLGAYKEELPHIPFPDTALFRICHRSDIPFAIPNNNYQLGIFNRSNTEGLKLLRKKTVEDLNQNTELRLLLFSEWLKGFFSKSTNSFENEFKRLVDEGLNVKTIEVDSETIVYRKEYSSFFGSLRKAKSSQTTSPFGPGSVALNFFESAIYLGYAGLAEILAPQFEPLPSDQLETNPIRLVLLHHNSIQNASLAIQLLTIVRDRGYTIDKNELNSIYPKLCRPLATYLKETPLTTPTNSCVLS